MMQLDPQAVGAGIAAGLWWSLMGYRLFAERGEPFDGAKLVRALLWGAVVGAWAGAMGFSPQMAALDLEHQIAALGALAAVTATLDSMSVGIWKWICAKRAKKRVEPLA